MQGRVCDTFQVSKEGGVHLLASPQLPPKSLCQGGLALCSQFQTVGQDPVISWSQQKPGDSAEAGGQWGGGRGNNGRGGEGGRGGLGGRKRGNGEEGIWGRDWYGGSGGCGGQCGCGWWCLEGSAGVGTGT